MNESQTHDLLVTITALDPSHGTSSQHEWDGKVAAWAGVLETCDYETTVKVVKAHYSGKNAKSIAVGDLRVASLRAAAADLAASRQRSGGLFDPKEEELRERHCHLEGCMCTHTECMGGWLDEEDVVWDGKLKKHYTKAKRCPVCYATIEARVLAGAR